MIEKTEGIVIRTLNYGETNKIITVLTPNFGKIGLMARGAKKAKSKLSSASQLFYHGHFLFQKGRGLGVLHQADSIHPFRHIKEDIVQMAYAAYIVELTDKIIEENMASSSLYKMLLNIFKKMDEGVPADILAIIYEVKVLPLAGLAANVDQCVHCGDRERPFFFTMSGGGYLCRNCQTLDPYSIPMTPEVSKLLTLFKHVPVDRLGSLSVKKQNIIQLKRILQEYYQQNAGLQLKSRRFLDQMERNVFTD